MEKQVCIIIPVKNISSQFEACLRSISALNYSNLELIIVDDSEEAELKIPIDNSNNKIKILYSRGKGPSYARNLAAENTNAYFLAFMDSDCIADKNWIHELLRGFELFPEAAACGGIQGLPVDATNFEKQVFLFLQKAGFITDYIKKSKKQDIIKVVHNASCCSMYKRSIFLETDGFLEGLWPGEDVELDYRLRRKGYNLYFNPKAIVYHHRPKCLRGFLRMMYRYGISCGILTRMYGIFRKIQSLPFLALTAVVFLLLAPLFHFLSAFLIVVGIVLCLLFIYVGLNISVFLLTCAAGISWNLGFVKGLLRGRKITV